MKRRDFLKQSGTAAVALAAVPVVLAGEQKPDWVSEFEANTWVPDLPNGITTYQDIVDRTLKYNQGEFDRWISAYKRPYV